MASNKDYPKIMRHVWKIQSQRYHGDKAIWTEDEMGLFSTKYIYVDVCFLNSQHPYTYRTNDSSIAVNTFVMVPAGNEVKPAIVAKVRTYKEKDVPDCIQR